MEIIINEDKGRIDLFLAKELNLSRSKVQSLMQDIKVNDASIDKNYRLKTGDIINVPEVKEESLELELEDIKLDIVYEDDDLLVLNKSIGMVVHPTPGNRQGTLVNALLAYTKLGGPQEERPGIVHRLDKDTSGLMVVAKTDFAYDKLVESFAKREVERKYLALVDGVINHETGTVDAPVGRSANNYQKMQVTAKDSKEAVTHFRVLKRFKNNTLLECKLETGRTHQIRIHMAYIGHPITNDPLYGRKKISKDLGQILHSYKISFIHPRSRQKIECEVGMPEEFEKICNKF